LVSVADDEVVSGASATLATIIRTAFCPSATGSGPQAFDPSAVAAEALTLVGEPCSEQVMAGAWHLLAAASLDPRSWDA